MQLINDIITILPLMLLIMSPAIIYIILLLLTSRNRFNCPKCNYYYYSRIEKTKFHNRNVLNKYWFVPKIITCSKCNANISLTKIPSVIYKISCLLLVLDLLLVFSGIKYDPFKPLWLLAPSAFGMAISFLFIRIKEIK